MLEVQREGRARVGGGGWKGELICCLLCSFDHWPRVRFETKEEGGEFSHIPKKKKKSKSPALIFVGPRLMEKKMRDVTDIKSEAGRAAFIYISQ